MTHDLLETPLRVSWDIDPADNRLSLEQLRLIARQLVEAGVFFVNLEVAPLSYPDISTLLADLQAGGCQVALQCTAEADEFAGLNDLPPDLKLYLDCASFVTENGLAVNELQSSLEQFRDCRREPFLYWLPGRGRLALLPEILEFCAAHAVRGFKLPNQKIGVNSGPEQSEMIPDCNDLELLRQRIESDNLTVPDDLQLEIHDFFIWELLAGKLKMERAGYSGCQAADSLAHIDSSGMLYPCSAWPVPLGRLPQESLANVWQKEQRRDIRSQVAEVPLGCETCWIYPGCLGGCRGLALFCRNDGLQRDLFCPAER